MQNRGAILAFAITLALVCIYQLSFTVATYKVKRDAAHYAQGDLGKESDYLDSIASLRKNEWNFLGNTFRKCQEKELNLGLDLKGGMNVILEISVVDIIQALSNYSTDTTFRKALALAKEYQRDSQEDFITLFGQAFEEIVPNARLAAIFGTLELKDRIDFNSTNREVLAVIRNEAQGAVDNAFNILRSRIDRFGVTQPNISQLETQGRILVELPGIKDPQRVRDLLQGTANLEFWETYENSEVFQYLIVANNRIREMESTTKTNEEAEEPQDITQEEGELLAEVAETDTAQRETSLLEMLEADTTQAEEQPETIDQFNLQNPLFAVLYPNTTRDGQPGSGSMIGYSHFRDTAKVNTYLNMPQIWSLFPRDVKFYWSGKAYKYDETATLFELHAIKITTRDEQAPLDGDVITTARMAFDQTSASAQVNMNMNGEGAKVWARLTRENIGRSIAVVLDEYVYSSPTVQTEIKNGSSVITGDFTIEEAEDLANKLKSGKLPAPARIIQEAIVGPSLGKEAIRLGLNSFFIAFVVVLLYMVFYYSHRAGFVADIALIVNMFFLIGVLASLNAVLTLPGIAGIILTIGISVDANVLIYERIREELKAGKGIKLAIADGYKNAYSAIIDANVTTLLTAIILYVLGTGPIKGFATTLVIGILTSLFSAIFITRLIFTGFLNRNAKLSFATQITENAFRNLNIDFIAKRKVFYVISGVIVLIGIVSLFTRGLNQGVDFTGGRNYVIRFEQPVNTVDIQNSLTNILGETPEVKTHGSSSEIRISTKFWVDSSGTDVDNIIEAKIFDGLKSYFSDDYTFNDFISQDPNKTYGRLSSEKVGPTIADDIKVQSIWAIAFSLVVIFLYIFIRFRNWQFGLGALTALIHDTLIVLGIFSLSYSIMPFSLEIDQAFIAAILMVVGYSINDTVVIYDRIREYIGLYKKRERKEIINTALNSVLSRTFSTSLSTFVVLLAVFVFGGEVIRGFTFALVIGVIVGTYSSLFIATPMVYDTIRKAETTRVLKGKRVT
ncbi:MAG: protein translocase subunit SecDF [Bacteroidetes bacterium]|nr:protein translocase subunit SecDF [Bacteroidota bacterium]